LLPTFNDASGFATLGFPINFGGVWYSNVWINADGNVTLDTSFGGRNQPNYLPAAPLSALAHVIFAPFWADVDTTTNGTGSIGWGTGCAYASDLRVGRQAFGVTWSKVGYYKGHKNKNNSFQLLIIDRSDVATGAFDLQYRYGGIGWDTADSASGINGLCDFGAGYPARVGYCGSNIYNFELTGSGVSGALVDGGANSLVANSIGSTNRGVYTWHFTNIVVSPNR